LSFQDRKNRTNCKEFQSRAWQAPTPLGGSLYSRKGGHCWIGVVMREDKSQGPKQIVNAKSEISDKPQTVNSKLEN
jgi:hypothetical protein